MVLGKTSSAGASYNLDYSRAGAYCACSRCRWGMFGHFCSHMSFLSSFSLSLGGNPREGGFKRDFTIYSHVGYLCQVTKII